MVWHVCRVSWHACKIVSTDAKPFCVHARSPCTRESHLTCTLNGFARCKIILHARQMISDACDIARHARRPPVPAVPSSPSPCCRPLAAGPLAAGRLVCCPCCGRPVFDQARTADSLLSALLFRNAPAPASAATKLTACLLSPMRNVMWRGAPYNGRLSRG